MQKLPKVGTGSALRRLRIAAVPKWDCWANVAEMAVVDAHVPQNEQNSFFCPADRTHRNELESGDKDVACMSSTNLLVLNPATNLGHTKKSPTTGSLPNGPAISKKSRSETVRPPGMLQ